MAKLLDRPFTNEEKRQILDMLRGNINRISVSNDIEEIMCQLNFAVDRLSAVAYSRIKELTGEENRHAGIREDSGRNSNKDGKQ